MSILTKISILGRIEGMKRKSMINTQIAIKFIQDTFERLFAKKLKLIRVSAPLFVKKSSGLNDELNGYERTVSFDVHNEEVEIVQSLAKWKRDALKRYDFPFEKGLYTDMNAIRRDEQLDHLHSIYVDQWDWEKVIKPNERTLDFLFKNVKDIYSVIYKIGQKVKFRYGYKHNLPKQIHFISTSELLTLYPNLSNKEREKEITKKHKAVFIYQIGWPLEDGKPFDGRASDYDDWNLNGDILVYSDKIDSPIELSSMGIRVNKDSLVKQVEFKNELDKLNNPYCKQILNDELPLTIGGGIGQSRLCMFYLNKSHIGEVQASYWPDEVKEKLKCDGLEIL